MTASPPPSSPRPRPAGGRGVTMKEVAARAGVNVSTVSRALRKPSGPVTGVSDEVAERIRRIARDMGYRPNPQAASLRGGRTRTIGLVIPRLTDVVLATIYEGIDEHASGQGYQTLVATTGDDPAERRRRLNLLLSSRRCDGLIVGDAHLDADEDHLTQLADRGVPLVLVNRHLPGHTCVTCDDITGGRLVAQHLWEAGHRVMGVVGGHPWASTARDRADGFRGYLAEHGVTLPDSHVLPYGFDGAAGHRATRMLLALTPRPTAIFAVNDYSALGVMGSLRDHGLTPGTDIAVAGFNDTGMARDLPIPLTSVDSGAHEMGAAAARSLLAKLDGEPAESLTLPPVLHPRASTAPRP